MPIIEFYTRPNGHTPASEFLTKIKDRTLQRLIDDKLEQLEKHGFKLDGDYFDKIEGNLHEFRLKLPRGLVRLFFIDEGAKFIFTNGVRKKGPRVPRDIAKAQRLMAEYYAHKK